MLTCLLLNVLLVFFTQETDQKKSLSLLLVVVICYHKKIFESSHLKLGQFWCLRKVLFTINLQTSPISCSRPSKLAGEVLIMFEYGPFN